MERTVDPACDRGGGEGPRPSTLGQLLNLSIPMLLANASVMIMVAVDTFFIANMPVPESRLQEREHALAGIGFAGPVIWMISSLFQGIIASINTFAAQVWGEGKRERIGLYLSQAAGVALACSIPAVLIGFFAPEIFGVLEIEEEAVHANASTYAQIRFWGLGFALFNLAVAGVYEGIGWVNVTTVVTLSYNVLNGFLAWAMVWGRLGFPAMGVEGAAIAAVISTAVGSATFIALLLRPSFWRSYVRPSLRLPGGAPMRDFLKVGMPQGLGWFLEASLWGVFIILVNRLLGSTVAAAQQLTIAILHFSFLPGMAVGNATTTLVGQAVGAGDIVQARRIFWRSLLLTGGYMGTVGLVFFFGRFLILERFTDDPQIIAIGAVILIYAAVWQLFDALYIASAGSLRGAGDTLYSAIIYFGTGWLIFLPSAYVLCKVFAWGIQGAWGAAAGFIMVAGVLAFARWQRGGWTRIRIYRRDEERVPDRTPAA